MWYVLSQVTLGISLPTNTVLFHASFNAFEPHLTHQPRLVVVNAPSVEAAAMCVGLIKSFVSVILERNIKGHFLNTSFPLKFSWTELEASNDPGGYTEHELPGL
jgi:hypothetical protein